LAKLVETGGGKLKGAVVPLHAGGGLETIFACGIALYQPLAMHLRGTCSSSGVYVPAEEIFFDHIGQNLGMSIMELAQSYTEAILEQHLRGPLVLGGVSFGGLLAFEIARQLRARCEPPVKALILLDPILPHGLRRNWRGSWRTWKRTLAAHGVVHCVKHVLARHVRNNAASEKTTEDKTELLRRALTGPITARYLESRPTYDGPTLLIRAMDHTDQLGTSFDLVPDLGWRGLLDGPVTTADAPGDHLGLLARPETADLIRDFLARLG
jgi:thioesterase domain-containing protein